MLDSLLAGRRILVVEDEMLVLMMIEDMLADHGCEQVTAAATTEQALSLIGAQDFDFAMLDMNLGGTMTYPVADALGIRGVPFAFSTGYSGHENPGRLPGPAGSEETVPGAGTDENPDEHALNLRQDADTVTAFARPENTRKSKNTMPSPIQSWTDARRNRNSNPTLFPSGKPMTANGAHIALRRHFDEPAIAKLRTIEPRYYAKPSLL